MNTIQIKLLTMNNIYNPMGRFYDFVLRGLNFSQCPFCGNEYPMRNNPKIDNIRVCPKCRKTYASDGFFKV